MVVDTVSEHVLCCYSEIVLELDRCSKWIECVKISSEDHQRTHIYSTVERLDMDAECKSLRQIISALNKGFERLTPEQKQVLALTYLGGKDRYEAAEWLSVVVGSVRRCCCEITNELSPECHEVQPEVDHWMEIINKRKEENLRLLSPQVTFVVEG